MIYLDNNATTRVCKPALQAFLHTPFGNPHSTHIIGTTVNNSIEEAKKTIAQCINCEPEEVFFVSSATEACNWAIQILLDKKCKLIYHKYEHSAVIKPILAHTLPTETECNGYVQMLVNNVYGEIYDIPIRENENDIIFCDGTAGIGHIKFNFKESGIDLLAFGAHKFNGIKGCGCLIIKERLFPVRSLIWGGDITGGTPMPELINACAAALKFNIELQEEHYQKNAKLQQFMWNEIKDMQDVYLNGPVIGDNRSSNNLNIGIKDLEGKLIQQAMSEKNICISTGSACSSDSFVEQQHGLCPRPKSADGYREPELITIFKAGNIGHPAEESIRITTDWMNTEDECATFIKELKDYIEFKKNCGIMYETSNIKSFFN